MATKLAVQSLLVCFFLSLATASTYQRTVSYADQVLVRCDRNGKGVEEFLGSDEADVWLISPVHADVRVSRDFFHSTSNLDCVEVANVEDLVRTAENRTFPAKPEADWFDQYHEYRPIVTWYSELASNNPNLVRFVPSIGQSVEGRDQPAIHITGPGGPKYRVFFQCQIHAREWISGAVCMYLADRLVKEHSSERLASLLEKVEFVFVPFANPDGYKYTWSNDHLWRKNRRPPPAGSTCYGVDLNRNFPFHWNEGGSSSNPCSETYMGTEASSEIETQNIMKYFRSQKPIIAAIDWHSFSQLILRPPGWSRNPSVVPDYVRFKDLGDMMKKEVFDVEGKTYTSQIAADLYIATGGAEDWFYSEGGEADNENRVVWAFTYELRPATSLGDGFLLPPDQIIPNGKEVYPAVLSFVEAVLDDNPGL